MLFDPPRDQQLSKVKLFDFKHIEVEQRGVHLNAEDNRSPEAC